jgi:hypothetical protein
MGLNNNPRDEAATTDKKTRTDDPRINEEDKHQLHSRRGKLDMPERDENPALKDLKEKRAQEGDE